MVLVFYVQVSDERLLLWPDQTFAMDVNVSHYDPATGAWAAPAPFLGQARQSTALTAGITEQGDLVVGLAALNPVSETLTLDDGTTFDMPGQAQSASLLVAGVTASFIPPPAMVTEAVRLAPQGGGNVLLWVGGGVMLLALAGGAVFWYKRAKLHTASKQ